MSIDCVPSDSCSDVRCAVCGQGFVLHGDTTAHAHCDRLRGVVLDALRHQHDRGGDIHAHPEGGFQVYLAPTDLLYAMESVLS